MKLGKDFWFWMKMLFEFLKIILGHQPKPNPTPQSFGERIFKSCVGTFVADNEDDEHTKADIDAL